MEIVVTSMTIADTLELMIQQAKAIADEKAAKKAAREAKKAARSA